MSGSPAEPVPSAEPVVAGPGEPFSLLLPVYAGDDPAFLRRAFASATHEQTRPPSEVVLVRDGPVPPELARVLDELAAPPVTSAPGSSGGPADLPRAGQSAVPVVPVVRVDLPVNVGLARALEAGLARCAHDLVARMDADDVSLPQRFARQLPLLEGGGPLPGGVLPGDGASGPEPVDIVGSALEEFGDDEHVVVAVRTPPLTHEAITSRARFHSPFNHPTVVYRRSVVARAGGYRDLPLLEDYWLFARMIAAGARTANVAEPLVRYRVGAGSYVRRGGLRLLRSELALQRHLLAEGFTTPAQAARNVVVRGGYRLVPVAVRRLAYRLIFTSGANRWGRGLRRATRAGQPPS